MVVTSSGPSPFSTLAISDARIKSSFSTISSFIVSSETEVSITATTCPTFITSSTLKSFSTKIPSTSLGISLSTLSVAISTTGSSKSTLSPTSFNHDVNVASATLSPILGNFNSNLAIIMFKL